MNNHQAVVEQIIQNLAFEVEAVPKNTIKTTNVSQNIPLSVKIRVRKKNETPAQHTSSVTEETERAPRRIRLVSSDQTIMSFDVFMDSEFEKQTLQKPQKHIFDIFRPGRSLGVTNSNDDYASVPTSSYSANISEPVTARSDGILKQNFTLSKNIYQYYSVSTQSAKQKWFFGKCKPGGCLDPPFSEDKYSYKPDTVPGRDHIIPKPSHPPKKKQSDEDVSDRKDCKKKKRRDEDDKSQEKRKSTCDKGLFKKKRKCSDKSTDTKLPDNKIDETTSNLSINSQSTNNSLTTHSNPIITYPPKVTSDLKMSEDKCNKSRGPSEDKPRKSLNDHSEPYFIPPKGINREKDKDILHQKNAKDSSTNVSDSSNKDSFKMPIPFPIPIPIPFVSKQRDCLETNEMELEGDSTVDNDINTEHKSSLIIDKTLEDSDSRTKSQSSEQQKWVESSKDIDSNVSNTSEQLTPEPNQINSKKSQHDKENLNNLNNDDEGLSESISAKDLDGKKGVKDNAKIEENLQKKPQLPIPIPIPIPIPFDTSKLNRPKIESSNNKNKELNEKNNDQDIIKEDTPRGSESSIINKESVHDHLHNSFNDQKSDSTVFDKAPMLEDGVLAPVFRDENTGLEDDENIWLPDKPTENVSEKNIYEITIPGIKASNEIQAHQQGNHASKDVSKNGTDSLSGNISPINSYKDNEPTKPQNIIQSSEQIKQPDKYDTNGLSGTKYASLITAPINIDNIAQTQNFEHIYEVYSETNLISEPIDKTFPKFKKRDDDNITQSSQELVGIKSFIYDSDLPSTSSTKMTEEIHSLDKQVVLPPNNMPSSAETKGSIDDFRKKRLKNGTISTPVLSCITSTNNLKSAMKKDIFSIALGFHSFFNEKNERILKTFDASSEPETRYLNDSITIIKTQIRKSSNEIRIAVDSEHDLSIQIKKSTTNQRVSISESGFTNMIDNSRKSKERSFQKIGGEVSSSDPNGCNKIVESDVTDSHVLHLYEHELVPLQFIIKSLRDEIDVLAAQQMLYRDKLYYPKKSNQPPLVHSTKKCYGCVKK